MRGLDFNLQGELPLDLFMWVSMVDKPRVGLTKREKVWGLDFNLQHEDLSRKLREELEKVFSFTCLTLLGGICIGFYIECCILVFNISFVHHASSCVSEKKISKVRKFLQKAKLSDSID